MNFYIYFCLKNEIELLSKYCSHFKSENVAKEMPLRKTIESISEKAATANIGLVETIKIENVLHPNLDR